MHYSFGTGPLGFGNHAQGTQGAGRFEVSKSKLNLAMAVAKVSDDRVLVASPSAEVELGLSISDA